MSDIQEKWEGQNGENQEQDELDNCSVEEITERAIAIKKKMNKLALKLQIHKEVYAKKLGSTQQETKAS